ncbi:hypothetical protein VB715_03930 [Crocosphaera sp. UHCC 0190]|uniref:hypothetical protein n=1 Tax=Crocosphaera sp. UHCC 0190 TaxID=3110246 RepID=UPI002B20982D|nr:hypothetical protein [Crocosphaera sp. UHCC 0190]MEA5508905.1 hypothetical protein [Crocosphaera sp. UHCC 0190]
MKCVSALRMTGWLTLASLVGVGNAQAATIIDTFDLPTNGSLTLNRNLANGTTVGVSSSGLGMATVGGTRDLTLTKTAGTGPPIAGSTITVSPTNNAGTLSWSNPTGFNSRFNVVWDADTNFNVIDRNGLNLSLKTADAFILTSSFIDILGTQATINVYSGSKKSALTIANLGIVPNGTPTDFTFEFSQFMATEGGGVNFAVDTIGAIELVVNGTANAIDARFEILTTRDAPPPVTEPVVSLLALSSAATLAGLTGKRQKLKQR